MIPFLQLKNSLTGNETSFCIYGNDRWVKLKAVQTVMDALGIDDDGFGVERLDAPSLAHLREACGTGSLFGGKKMVLCDNFVFPSGKQCAEAVAELSRLALALNEHDPNGVLGGVCLVFLAETSANFDKTTIQTVCCNKLDATSVAKWIVAYGKRHGAEIDPACARKIGECCLWDMSRVETETQKLIDYGEISLRSVDLLVHRDAEYAVFDLSKHIADRDAQAAVELYRGLTASGEEARGLFGLLYNFYRRAYYAKTSDLSTERIAELLSVKPFAAERAAQIASRYKAMQLKRILDCFDSADKKLRAFLDEDEVMIALIFQIVTI